jgi:hypothetical protein
MPVVPGQIARVSEIQSYCVDSLFGGWQAFRLEQARVHSAGMGEDDRGNRLITTTRAIFESRRCLIRLYQARVLRSQCDGR